MAIVSDLAKKGLDALFTKAVTSHLILQPSDSIQIEPIPDYKRKAIEEKQFFILTIANFFFKVLVIFHVNHDEKTMAYFSRPDAELGFDDVFPEICNLCCGALNRELGFYFPHLGMSTPYQLDRDCLDFMDLLRPAHLSQFHIQVNGEVELHATLCVCAYRPLDFRFDTLRALAAPLEETGVLELF
ncbi:MAG: hypothetical protein RIR18_162 [Pseudomonadota bacterium]|jgi:hypothetical protein